MKAIVAEDLTYEYPPREKSPVEAALDNIAFSVEEGEFVAVVGRNGSGKSTLAKTLNGLLVPSSGTVSVFGRKTSSQELIWDIRSTLGMVFQNPDNQIVATTVEEDVAFGPENLGIEPVLIRERVLESLEKVNMGEYLEHSPAMLSGGQKQRIAIAGVLAMHPRCLVLDEATSMLDPAGRQDVMRILKKLNHEDHITIVLITHHMDEAAQADRVLVMDQGKCILEGTPGKVFREERILQQAGLDIPQVSALYLEAAQAGFIEDRILPVLLEEAEELFSRVFFMKRGRKEPEQNLAEIADAEEIIHIQNLSYTYMPNTPYERQALQHISLTVRRGELLGIIGHTGSGKSTLIQHLNGLLVPAEGNIQVSGMIPKGKALKELRRKVGLIFQNPEDQLFEETVEQDISFGLRRLGLSEAEIHARVMEAMEITGLPSDVAANSPFELSGGQKRRVAIAGVIVMNPEILVLDEPTAGLDPQGSYEIYQFLLKLRREKNTTIIIVSHSMEEIARYCDRVAVLEQGKLAMLDKTRKVFSQKETLEKIGLDVPQVTELFYRLHSKNPNIRKDILTVDEGFMELKRVFL